MRHLTTLEEISQWLNQFEHPDLIAGWASVNHIVSQPQPDTCRIQLPFASRHLKTELAKWISAQQDKGDVTPLNIQIEYRIKPLQTPVEKGINGIKNVIAVTSAKGGVGKSTTAVNLALAIAQTGSKVGLLDADIYGPSVPMMLGTQDANPQVVDEKWMLPVSAHGIYSHSIGYLVDKSEAAIWRGPMASKALEQLLNETRWPDLDYLVIDMPPGTGDIQLTLAQQIPVTGALIVTTPQDLALADARKGATMFSKVNVPVVGLVENMSYHICSHCGAKEYIFGVGGASSMAREYGLALLAQIPLHISMREDIDSGRPTVISRPESEFAGYYQQLADKVCSRMYWQGKEKAENIAVTLV